MKRRARAVLGPPSTGQALFVKPDSSVEWADLVTASASTTRTWSADATRAKAADLAARCVRVQATEADDGKYAKYTPAGFVLARADDVAVAAGSATPGTQGAPGTKPAGAQGYAPLGDRGAGGTSGAMAQGPQGAPGAAGTSAQGNAGAQGHAVQRHQRSRGPRGPRARRARRARLGRGEPRRVLGALRATRRERRDARL